MFRLLNSALWWLDVAQEGFSCALEADMGRVLQAQPLPQPAPGPIFPAHSVSAGPAVAPLGKQTHTPPCSVLGS